MKKIRWIFIFISIFIVLHSCTSNSKNSNQTYYVECGQVVMDRDRRFYIYSEKNIKGKSYRGIRPINIVEKYLTMELMLFIMYLYVKVQFYEEPKQSILF